MVRQPVVLVLEDNSELRHVLKEALSTEGYRVLAARDESDALELLRGSHVDLVISDPQSSITALLTAVLSTPGRSFRA